METDPEEFDEELGLDETENTGGHEEKSQFGDTYRPSLQSQIPKKRNPSNPSEEQADLQDINKSSLLPYKQDPAPREERRSSFAGRQPRPQGDEDYRKSIVSTQKRKESPYEKKYPTPKAPSEFELSIKQRQSPSVPKPNTLVDQQSSQMGTASVPGLSQRPTSALPPMVDDPITRQNRPAPDAVNVVGYNPANKDAENNTTKKTFTDRLKLSFRKKEKKKEEKKKKEEEKSDLKEGISTVVDVGIGAAELAEGNPVGLTVAVVKHRKFLFKMHMLRIKIQLIGVFIFLFLIAAALATAMVLMNSILPGDKPDGVVGGVGGGAIIEGPNCRRFDNTLLTTYYPGKKGQEGGIHDAFDRDAQTIYGFIKGQYTSGKQGNYVTLAGDIHNSSSIFYIQGHHPERAKHLFIPEFEAKFNGGNAITFEVADTGGAFKNTGTSHLDVAMISTKQLPAPEENWDKMYNTQPSFHYSIYVETAEGGCARQPLVAPGSNGAIAVNGDLASRIIQIALNEANNPPPKVETSLDSGPNIDKYFQGHKPGVAWCAYFATWVFKQAGSNIPTFSYALDVEDYYKKNNRWSNTPHPGDAVTFLRDKGSGRHAGIVVAVRPDGSFDTVEGNASNRVRQEHHRLSDAVGFGSPF